MVDVVKYSWRAWFTNVTIFEARFGVGASKCLTLWCTFFFLELINHWIERRGSCKFVIQMQSIGAFVSGVNYMYTNMLPWDRKSCFNYRSS